MLDSLDMSSYRNNPAALTALGKGREDKAAQKAEAVKLGRGVGSDQQLETKVREVAEDFVSVFMNQVMKSMRDTVPENPAMHGDNGEKFFQEMLDTEQSKFLAKGSGYGLTDLIYESLMSSYRVQQQPGAAAVPDATMDTEASDEPEMAAVAGVA